MKPFRIEVAPELIADLHKRLDATRWPTEAMGEPWRFGTDLNWMRSVAKHWRHGYDWWTWQEKLNRLSHFIVKIQGLDTHFVMERGSGHSPLPLILGHGWPGSFVEFLDVIDPLAHPERHGGRVEDAFTVIVPSLPGYGFSAAPSSLLRPDDVARIWSKLMCETLGFERYVAQGGDWGGIVMAHLALSHSRNLSAIHLNVAALLPPQDDPANPLTEDERAWKRRDDARRADLTGYHTIQGTRPQTLAYGLTDSPVGSAAWILEKFHDWTVRGKDIPPPFDLDHLLTNVMLYWIRGIGNSFWIYASVRDGTARNLPPGRKVEIPTGFMLCPADAGEPPPDSWLRRSFNMVHRNDAPTGGHFLALEQPELFAKEVTSFFRSYR